MNDFKKNEYLKFLFHRAKSDLAGYELESSQRELINNLFGRLSASENLLKDLFILSQIKELHNIGKYLIFILKKIEDEVINFDNFKQNLSSDSEFIEKELLNYFSNPEIKSKADEPDTGEKYSEISGASDEDTFKAGSNDLSYENELLFNDESESENDNKDEEEISLFKKNYLELIQTGETDEEIVYELPNAAVNSFSIPENKSEDYTTEKANPEIDSDQTSQHDTDTNITADENAFDLPHENKESEIIREDIKAVNEQKITGIDSADEMDGTFRIKKVIRIAETEDSTDISNEKSDIKQETDQQYKTENEKADRIKLSRDIQEELNLFKEEAENESSEEDENTDRVIVQEESEPANSEFVSFESEVRKKNDELDKEFDIMIYLVNAKPGDEEERKSIIGSIIDSSAYLENISRKMSLEIISNIYQTIILSFEKISDGKYDISESTLNLFKKGILLVDSLIKGDDYFGYKDILKSIENIRNSLIDEKAKIELYKRQQREKQEIEKQIDKRFPDDSQKEKLSTIRQLIFQTEENLNTLANISGEYRIYEALRNLSLNLNNLKDMVRLSKELNLKKTGQISEASYIFIKFLQNYRINPLTDEISDIFRYIIYNLKSSIINKHVDDFEIFISYLNDPVKIFSKAGKKKP